MNQALSNIRFRPFSAEDFTAVQEMHTRSFRQLALGHYTADEVAAHEKMFREAAYLDALSESNMTLAMMESEIIGSAGWCLLEPKVARIRKVFVHPSHANRGLGRLLLSRVESEIRTLGIKDLTLRASMNAVSFYEKSGFTAIKSEKMLLEPNVSVLVMTMRKALEPIDPSRKAQ